MKAILEFKIPLEEENFELALKSRDWYNVVWDLNQWIRSQTKYAPDTMSEDTHKALSETRNKLFELLEHNNLKL